MAQVGHLQETVGGGQREPGSAPQRRRQPIVGQMLTWLERELLECGVPLAARQEDLGAVERVLSWFIDTVGDVSVDRELVRDEEDVYLRASAPVAPHVRADEPAESATSVSLVRGSLDVHVEAGTLVLVIQMPLEV